MMTRSVTGWRGRCGCGRCRPGWACISCWGCCLFSTKPYLDVIGEVTAGLRAALAAVGWVPPATTALTRVRRRVGERPLESLFRRLCGALSPGRAAWSHLGGLLVVAVDGTTVGAYGSPENAAAFGRPAAPGKRRRPAGGGQARPDGTDRDEVANPQLRLVTLVACGTRALLDAAFGPVRGRGTGEQALARGLLGSLRPGMLLLADKNFYGYDLWRAAAGTGAHLLWRVKASTHLPVVRPTAGRVLAGSRQRPRRGPRPAHKNGQRRRRGSTLPPDTGPLPGITVRVIEYVLTVTTDDGADPHRTVPADHHPRRLAGLPGRRLAACYALRWAIETGYRECKTYLRGPGRILRGRTPDLARQELWAYLAIYQAIRAIIVRAAAGAGLDPDRISFTATLNAAQRTMTTGHGRLAATLAATETEIVSCLVPQRDGRVCPRAVNKPSSPVPVQAQPRRPPTTTRRLHRHHHHARPSRT